MFEDALRHNSGIYPEIEMESRVHRAPLQRGCARKSSGHGQRHPAANVSSFTAKFMSGIEPCTSFALPTSIQGAVACLLPTSPGLPQPRLRGCRIQHSIPVALEMQLDMQRSNRITKALHSTATLPRVPLRLLQSRVSFGRRAHGWSLSTTNARRNAARNKAAAHFVPGAVYPESGK